MKIKKVMLALCHTKEGGPSEYDGTELPESYIGNIGRDRINDIALPCKMTDTDIDIFGSGTASTHQELLCLVMKNILTGTIHDPLFGMGTNAMFADWNAVDLRKAAQEAGSNIRGLHQILSQDSFKNTCQSCADEINNAFLVMKHPYGLGIFHQLTIEMAGHALGMPFPDSLAEGTGLVFVQYDDGSIVCIGAWKSGEEIPLIE